MYIIGKSSFSTSINFEKILIPVYILTVFQEIQFVSRIESFRLFVAMVPQSAVSLSLIFKSFQIKVTFDPCFFFFACIFHKTDRLNLKIFTKNFSNMLFFFIFAQKSLMSWIGLNLAITRTEQVHNQLKLAFCLAFLQEFHSHF